MNDTENSGDRPLILVADDDYAQRLLMREALEQSGFAVEEADDGEQALARFQERRPDMVVSDVMMPRLDGFGLCARLRQGEGMAHFPIVLVTSLNDEESIDRAYQMGATDFIAKPVNWPLLGHRVRYILRAARTAQALACSEHELTHSRFEIIRRLGQAAEYRDNETGQHVLRMSHYSAALAEALGLPAAEVELLRNAAPMHDVGKIGIPDRILLKPGRLSEEEYTQMQAHTLLGGRLLDDHSAELMRVAHVIALSHHERWDGGGYPFGLAGEKIPLFGRICALADVFDALTSSRPYKEPWPVERAAEEIRAQSGTQFDPRVVEAFDRVLPRLLEIRERFADGEG